MREIVFTDRFRKDLKAVLAEKVMTPEVLFEELDYLIDLVHEGQPLPPQFREHRLQGKLFDFIDVHLARDVIVLLRLTDHRAVFARIGTHLKLFRVR